MMEFLADKKNKIADIN